MKFDQSCEMDLDDGQTLVTAARLFGDAVL
jgi:hypothetical protein